MISLFAGRPRLEDGTAEHLARRTHRRSVDPADRVGRPSNTYWPGPRANQASAAGAAGARNARSCDRMECAATDGRRRNLRCRNAARDRLWNQARRLYRRRHTRRLDHHASRLDGLTDRVSHSGPDRADDVGAVGEIFLLHQFLARVCVPIERREATPRRQNRHVGIDRFDWLGAPCLRSPCGRDSGTRRMSLLGGCRSARQKAEQQDHREGDFQNATPRRRRAFMGRPGAPKARSRVRRDWRGPRTTSESPERPQAG